MDCSAARDAPITLLPPDYLPLDPENRAQAVRALTELILSWMQRIGRTQTDTDLLDGAVIELGAPGRPSKTVSRLHRCPDFPHARPLRMLLIRLAVATTMTLGPRASTNTIVWASPK